MTAPPRAAAPRRLGITLAWLAGCALALLLVVRTPFSADMSAFLPRSPDAQQRMLIEQLESGTPSRTLLVGVRGGTAEARAEASRALARTLRASARFEQVLNGEREAWAEAGRWIADHRYALSPAVEPARFTAAGLSEALAETLSLLGTPAGGAVRSLLERDPSGEVQRIAEALIPARSPRLEQGVWAAREGGRALLLATTRAPGADLDGQQAAIVELRGAFAALGARELNLELSGAPLFAVTSRERIEREVQWLAVAGTLAMSALLLLAFASPRALAVALVPVGTGVLAGIAAVGAGFGQVHGLTLGFGATLIGEAVDYAIYYLVQARAAAAVQPGAGWRGWLATGWPTVRLGLWTSIAGFGALVFSGFPGLAQLGVFSIAGLLAAALTTRFLLPAWLPDGASGEGARRWLGALAAALVRLLPRLRWPLLAAGLAAALLVAQRTELWRADLTALSPLAPEMLALDRDLRAGLGTSDARALVVVQGPDAETTLQRAEATAARLESLVQQRRLGGFDSVTHLLPSQATQQARRTSLPEPAALQSALAEATRGTPLSPARLAPFVAEVEAARHAAPLTAATLRGTPLAPMVDALLLARRDGSHAALLPLHPVGETLDTGAVRAVLAGLAGTQLLDIKHELDALYQRYVDEALWQSALGALAVLALIAGSLRRPRRVLAVVQPLVLAVLLVLGALAALGVTLGILHLVGMLLVVAVGSNYALFFDRVGGSGTDRGADHSAGGASADPDTLASLLLANLTTVFSFGLLAFSAIPALSAIGLVVAPGALLALLLAAAFASPQRRGGDGR
ncbi:MAG: MMPL family transporter [Rubrivivax sp.]|nr:MMPL family transporter [Rubrivivax sp.]